ISRDGLLLLGKVVDRPSVIAGSVLTLFAGPRKGEQILKSHTEMAYLEGTNVAVRVPRQDMTEGVWQQVSNAGQVRVEIVARSLVKPELIKTLGELASFIRERREYAVGGVLGPAEYLSTTRFMARPNDPKARVLPDDPGEIKLMWDYYGLARGPHRLHQIV